MPIGQMTKNQLRALSKDDLLSYRIVVSAELDLNNGKHLPKDELLTVDEILREKSRSAFNRSLFKKMQHQFTLSADTKINGWHYGNYDIGVVVDWLLDNYDIKEK